MTQWVKMKQRLTPWWMRWWPCWHEGTERPSTCVEWPGGFRWPQVLLPWHRMLALLWNKTWTQYIHVHVLLTTHVCITWWVLGKSLVNCAGTKNNSARWSFFARQSYVPWQAVRSQSQCGAGKWYSTEILRRESFVVHNGDYEEYIVENKSVSCDALI